MAEAILVLNRMPRRCEDCPFEIIDDEYNLRYCCAFENIMYAPTKKGEKRIDCPLREVTEKDSY